MNFDQVIEKFSLLSGLESNTANQWRWLCMESFQAYKERIRTENEQDGCCDSVSAAAAAFAYYKYTLLHEEKETNSFKAGDVTIGFSNHSIENAYTIWKQAEQSAAKWLKDDGFYFRKVRS